MGRRMAKEGYVRPTADDCRHGTHRLQKDLPGIRGPMTFRPETAKPLNELVDVLLRGPHTLTPGERELIATYVSARNDCRYCQTIHGAVAAHHLGGDEALVLNVKRDSGARGHLRQAQGAAGHRRQDRRERQAGDRGRRRACTRARGDGSRDSRHRAHRRRVLPVQPLRRRPGDLGAGRSRFLPAARRAHRRTRLHGIHGHRITRYFTASTHRTSRR